MHIVIDLQGAQSESRTRGIGRYSEALALGLTRIAMPRHRVTVLLSAAFPHSINPIRQAFEALPHVPAFRIWEPLSPSRALDEQNAWRRGASEALYTAILHDLSADVVLVSSLFEGFGDDAIAAVEGEARRPLMAVVLYDLIPLINPALYLENPLFSAWYHNRIAHLRRADLLLAISASSRQEAIDHIGSSADRTTNISSAIDSRFRPLTIAEGERQNLLTRYGLSRPFVMYTGGIDHRKNIEGLIAAFAALPAELRRQHQLAVVCSISDHDRKRLLDLARRKGLDDGDLVLTGFIPDDDLVALYNLCALFIFPSKHEGFGLPTLEAMACGAPTLASNTSSLPEVVGWDEALFDPFETDAIARALERGLTDRPFRAALKSHALKQSREFSWEASARRALAEFERLHAERKREQAASSSTPPPARRRPRLAYVSPLQPAASGIADYSAELLPELAADYDIDVVVEQTEAVSDPWVLGNAGQRSVAWFDAHAHEYDRILYHFGNSHFHQHMFGLLERHPGVVVLHDFFLSGVAAHREVTGAEHGFWSGSLVRSHGWEALQARFAVEDAADVMYAYPCNLAVLQRALGIIVHSEYSCSLAERWYGKGFADDWVNIPHLRAPMAQMVERRKARESLRISDDVFVVCAFGQIDKTKLNLNLVEAWNASALGRDPNALLVFVGQEEGGEYGQEVRSLIQGGQGRIQITGRVDEATYKRNLMAADVGVQLRTLSRGETSGTVLDCMNYGLPTVVNAHGSMADLPRDAVVMLPDEFSVDELLEALERLQGDAGLRQELGARAQAQVHSHHQPRACAEQYAQAIERYYERAQGQALGFVEEIRRLGAPTVSGDLVALAERMAQIYPPKKPAIRQLLIDISKLHQRDAKSGIQRVVRSELRELLRNPPEGFRIEPVFATHDQGYRYARRYTARFLGLGDVPLEDSPLYAAAGDVFWGMDFQPEVVTRHSETLNGLRQRGVRVVFTVYDLLPLLLPEAFVDGATAVHSRWLMSLARTADCLLCISKTVAQRTREWLDTFGPSEGHALKLGWSHLGADVDEQAESEARPRLTMRQSEQLDAIVRCPSFLMVGTLEPRKAQAQALAAFDLLWSQGVEVNLVIVGEQGWLVDELAERLRSHPLRERHLFWLESIDDEMQERVYGACTCLLAVSLDEGYGLPLVEAARHELPILARDIPVFREVAGEHAHYFSTLSPQGLAQSVREWLRLFRQDRHIKSDAMLWMTWAQATHEMLDLVLHDGFQDKWMPRKDETLVVRHWGSNPQLDTQAGAPEGTRLVSTGREGCLLHGPYLGLKRGRYVARLFGAVGTFGLGRAHADVCVEGGNKVLAERRLCDVESEADGLLVELPFVLEEGVTELEVRLFVDAHTDLSVASLEIRRAARETRDDSALHAVLVERRGANPRQWRYWATHSAMQTQVGYAQGRSLYATGREGVLMCGPYIAVPAGAYRVTLNGEAETPEGATACVVSGEGEVLHAKSILSHSRGAGRNNSLCELDFTLDAYVEDLEIRILVGRQTLLRLDGATLAETAEPRRIRDGVQGSSVSSLGGRRVSSRAPK